MGKILMIGGEKGGVGKSTTAINLAVFLKGEGHDCMLLDADKQATATRWVERRNASGYPIIHNAQKLKNIYNTAIDLASRYDFIIIDAGGRDSEELRTGMVAADLLYVPLRASQADLETLPVVDELIMLSRGMNPGLQVRALLCMVPATSINTEAKDAKELLEVFPDIPLSGCIISDLKIYRDALKLGKGVVEMKNSTLRQRCNYWGRKFWSY
jgi:chromosome partitioning protein